MVTSFVPQRPRFSPRHIGTPMRALIEHTVEVTSADTLWSIAAEHLPPDADDWEIAHAWPIWWHAHRDIIGEDPGHLKPGTVLTIPEEFRGAQEVMQ